MIRKKNELGGGLFLCLMFRCDIFSFDFFFGGGFGMSRSFFVLIVLRKGMGNGAYRE